MTALTVCCRLATAHPLPPNHSSPHRPTRFGLPLSLPLPLHPTDPSSMSRLLSTLPQTPDDLVSSLFLPQESLDAIVGIIDLMIESAQAHRSQPQPRLAPTPSRLAHQPVVDVDAARRNDVVLESLYIDPQADAFDSVGERLAEWMAVDDTTAALSAVENVYSPASIAGIGQQDVDHEEIIALLLQESRNLSAQLPAGKAARRQDQRGSLGNRQRSFRPRVVESSKSTRALAVPEKEAIVSIYEQVTSSGTTLKRMVETLVSEVRLVFVCADSLLDDIARIHRTRPWTREGESEREREIHDPYKLFIHIGDLSLGVGAVAICRPFASSETNFPTSPRSFPPSSKIWSLERGGGP
ncbi:uncharacterized protein BJ171DRAFT_106518 [Polychytrium aggregatum]|uniref:uncharacterized protein n=1 Tax=Polychytrium aggregatum TaxID=110093 RepID=UPI0022FDF22D|nr:uncharacterized protein BJ171DRAFT_106518 [Polychytrium aggregatum]KAI9204411.1 hypothetical protein BJ171DRAFT_106518 [Polychytrium aggregatum]